MEREISRPMGAASAEMWTLHWSVVVPADPRSDPHLMWVVMEETRSRIQEETSFLLRRSASAVGYRGRVTVIFGRGSKPMALGHRWGSNEQRYKIVTGWQGPRTEGLKSGPTTIYLNSRKSLNKRT